MSHHTFDINIAQEHGIEAALLIHHIAYWIEFNERMGKNFHDGKTWMYQTLEEIQTHFPYMTRKKIFYVLQDLEKKGILIKSNFNKNKFNKTLWYTFTNKEKFTVFQKWKIEKPDLEHGDSNSGTCIYTDTKTDPKEEDVESSSRASSFSDDASGGDETFGQKTNDLTEKIPKDSSDVVVMKTNGKSQSMAVSEIYRQFLKKPFSTDEIEEAIERIRSVKSPINNIIKYLESVCMTIKREKNHNKSKPLKEKKKTDKVSEKKVVKENLVKFPYDEYKKMREENDRQNF